MVGIRQISGLVPFLGLLPIGQAQTNPKEDLILADCGIGDNKQHPQWSTSRQINWYKELQWPGSAYQYPKAPDQVVEVPYRDGIYPWVEKGVTATLPDGQVWTAKIRDATPDGFKAGFAYSLKTPHDTLNCWAYRGRPVSAAVNQTISDHAVCWTAFVCNRDNEAPKRPADMSNPTSTPATASAPPATTSFSTNPGAVTETETAGTDTTTETTGQGTPEPTQSTQTGVLALDAAVNPRFINWPSTWDSFINNFVWDQRNGQCIGSPVKGVGYNITFGCAGIQIDQDSHMTLLLIKALRDVGLHSLWFNQSPTLPPGTGQGNSTSWVVMPEAFTLSAVDAASSQLVGYISYSTTYDGFLAGPCSTCETARFNASFFDPIIAAMEGSYPKYYSFTVQAECKPWMVCK